MPSRYNSNIPDVIAFLLVHLQTLLVSAGSGAAGHSPSRGLCPAAFTQDYLGSAMPKDNRAAFWITAESNRYTPGSPLSGEFQ